MLLLKSTAVREGSANAAGFVHFDGSFFPFPRTHAYDSGHINVACGEESVVDISVQSTFRQHDFIGMVESDVVNGLPLEKKGRNQAV